MDDTGPDDVVLFRRLGAEALRDMLRRHIDLASGFADRVRMDDRFELVAPSPFSTVCFRAVQATDDGNRRLLEEVNRRGRVFLSHTELAGQFVLRLAVGSAHVRDEDIEAAWTELTQSYEDLLNN